MNLQLIKNVLSQPWLIESDFAMSMLPVVGSIVSGTFTELDAESSSASIYGHDEEGLSTTIENSIAVINLEGVLMKSDGPCGAAGTKAIGSWVKEADSNPNIKGIIFNIDSPGGTVSGTEELAKIVASVSKPTVSIIEGMMASAAYWIGSQTDLILSSNKTDIIGSIGTQLSYVNPKGFWKKKGIIFKDLVAKKSKDKNKASRDAENGDYTLLIDMLDDLNDVFLSSVKSARPNLNQEDTLSGKVFFPAQAIENGLIDGMGTMQTAIEHIQTNSNENKFSMQNKYPALSAALGQEFEMTDEGIHFQAEALDALELAMNSGSIQATLDALATANTTIETLTTERDEAKSSMVNKEIALAKMTTDRDEWQAKAEEWGAKSSSEGATPTAPSSEVKDENQYGYAHQEDGLKEMIPNFSHSK